MKEERYHFTFSPEFLVHNGTADLHRELLLTDSIGEVMLFECHSMLNTQVVVENKE
ncbi:hypothetical protein SCLCIDRAFT_1207796 [Scleroderma citrinum Foug A]|uniref:Uncharacterized protein n=1 Tax=Scleroderma citrinum Foug A TaxID=1036808 RepID=A0A0C3EMF5_9AGAM|nr:hypothetical protein SCLCIDRAFT_1207796 [Scleroderma citrinum Foug A]